MESRVKQYKRTTTNTTHVLVRCPFASSHFSITQTDLMANMKQDMHYCGGKYDMQNDIVSEKHDKPVLPLIKPKLL